MTKANPTPEREFQTTLVSVLEVFGYVVEHTYPLRTQHGWRTGSTLKGKPDLIALRPPRLLAIEVKGEHTVLEEPQRAVLSLYAEIPSCRAWVIRPNDPPWPVVQEWIRRPYPAPAVHGFEPMTVGQAKRVIAASRRRKRPSRRGSTGEQRSTGQLALEELTS